MSFVSARWRRRPGEVFTLEYQDGRFALGQILGEPIDLMRGTPIALFDASFSSSGDAQASVEATTGRKGSVVFALFVVPSLFQSGDWNVVGIQPVVAVPRENDPRLLGSPTIYSPGVVFDLLCAYHGTGPWVFAIDPSFADRLLVPPHVRPLIPTRAQ
jgi:hypothetical protein